MIAIISNDTRYRTDDTKELRERSEGVEGDGRKESDWGSWFGGRKVAACLLVVAVVTSSYVPAADAEGNIGEWKFLLTEEHSVN